MRKFAIAAAVAAVPLMVAAPSFAAPQGTFKLGVTPNKAARCPSAFLYLRRPNWCGLKLS